MSGVGGVVSRGKVAYRVVEPQISAEGVHVWPFQDPSFPVDVTFLRFDSRHLIRMNRHNFFEIAYVYSGSGTLGIQDRILTAKKGDLLVIGSTLYHRITGKSRMPLVLAALFFEPNLIRTDSGVEGTELLAPFLWQDPDFPHIVPAKTGIPTQVFDLMQQIRGELPSDDPRVRLAVRTYLRMILALLMMHFSAHTGGVARAQRQEQALARFQPLFRYLEEKAAEPMHIRDAARICAMSESHFMALFKATTGQSFTAYLNHYRVERAQSLLTRTDKTISEISQELGFCDQSYFGTVFRRLSGMTPASYRRRSRPVLSAGPS